MRLEDLKIGDRVKFNKNLIGIIKTIGNDYFEIDETEYRPYPYITRILKESIISKLEPIFPNVNSYGPAYKEIPIEKEENNSKDELIKKMENCEKSFKKSGWDTSYLIINKEKFYICNRCNHYCYCDEIKGGICINCECELKNKKENHFFHCPIVEQICDKCKDKEEWVTLYCKCGNKTEHPKTIDLGGKYVCGDCLDKLEKEKSAPKSYKFDIKITAFIQEIERYGGPSTNKIDGYSLSDGTSMRFENIPSPEWIDFNKEYTIEIKEKE